MKRVGYPILKPAAFLFLGGLLLQGVGAALAFSGDPEQVALAALGALVARLGGLVALFGFLLPLLYDWIRARTSADDRALFGEALADLLEMGIPADEAVARLGQDMRGNAASSLSRTAFAALAVAEAMRQGTTLSEAVRGTRAFPDPWADLLRVGEALERLPEALRALARVESRQGYVPAEVLVRGFVFLPIAGGILLFLATYILPTFTALFEGMQLELPLATRILIGGRHLVPIPVLLLVPLAGLLAFSLLFRPAREYLLALASRLATGTLQAQATVCSALAAGVRLGLDLPEALGAARSSVPDPQYRKALQATPGQTLADVMDAHPRLFQPQVRWLARQGERYGNLAEGLEACGVYLDEVAEQVRSRRRVLVEVALTGAMGLLLLLMMAGTLLPITRITVEALLP